MSESLLGVSVAATRQNSGSVLYELLPPPPPRATGGENCPAGTTWADVIFPSVKATAARLSHVAANAEVADRHVTAPATNAMVVLIDAIDNRKSRINNVVIAISGYCLS